MKQRAVLSLMMAFALGVLFVLVDIGFEGIIHPKYAEAYYRKLYIWVVITALILINLIIVLASKHKILHRIREKIKREKGAD